MDAQRVLMQWGKGLGTLGDSPGWLLRTASPNVVAKRSFSVFRWRALTSAVSCGLWEGPSQRRRGGEIQLPVATMLDIVIRG